MFSEIGYQLDGDVGSTYSLPEAELSRQSVVSFISHEFGNPLATIKGFLDIVLDGKAGSLTQLQLEFLTMAKSSALRLCCIIDDVSDLGLAARGAFRLEIEESNLGQIIRRVVDNLRPLADSKRVSLENLFPDPGLTMGLDRRRLEKGLFNLVTQAVKFAPTGSRITVSGGALEDRAQIIVAGLQWDMLPAEYVEVLHGDLGTFDLDRRRDSTLLGAGVARYVAERHGGEIRLDGRPEGAVRICLSLPIAGCQTETI